MVRCRYHKRTEALGKISADDTQANQTLRESVSARGHLERTQKAVTALPRKYVQKCVGDETDKINKFRTCEGCCRSFMRSLSAHAPAHLSCQTSRRDGPRHVLRDLFTSLEAPVCPCACPDMLAVAPLDAKCKLRADHSGQCPTSS